MNTPPASLDPRQFRNAMGLFATGVAVVAAPATPEHLTLHDEARHDEEVVAMTVNAVSSLSLDPMLVLFCPSRKSRFAQHIDSLAGFTINFLREDQQALATFFAGSWTEPAAPPFRFVPAQCAPRLEGSLASLHCEREQLVEAGDHWIVMGRVQALQIGIPPHKPLLFFGGRYRRVDFTESTPAPDLTDVHDEPAHIFYDHW
jgi:3-hydroxy-9,10-secoandrosta-1,3,5(10)-triene-9,17-dione monooxygenase reductase component